jgi:hypothetical protein
LNFAESFKSEFSENDDRKTWWVQAHAAESHL